VHQCSYIGPPLSIESAPIIHCFLEEDYINVTFSTYIGSKWRTVTSSNQSWSHITRLCEPNELPSHVFAYSIGPMALVLLGLSLASSWCLQQLGDYLVLYRVQKKLICSNYKENEESQENQSAFSRFLNWCRLPFIHPSLIQDYLKHFEELNEEEKAELAEVFDECLKSDIEVVNKKDPIYGQTAMHVALNGTRSIN
jgi:hypothetical protein